jgi:hypothetical protein
MVSLKINLFMIHMVAVSFQSHAFLAVKAINWSDSYAIERRLSFCHDFPMLGLILIFSIGLQSRY